MILIDGKSLANEIILELKQEINNMPLKPGLGIIIVGDRADSHTYVRMKKRACEEVGIYNLDIVLPCDSSEDEIINAIKNLNYNDKINGILVQLPLPKHINQDKVLNYIRVDKDVDGFHPKNMGALTLNLYKSNFNPYLLPCTPQGCIELLNKYNIDIEGKQVTIVGCSNIVGLPLSLMLLHQGATVSICHLKTADIKVFTKTADILIVACGCPKLITADHVKDDVVIIDVGINYVTSDKATSKSGKILVGDVDFESVSDKVKAITPVPGGVGPMTIAMLLKNTFKAALHQCLEEANRT